jgi:hypothetical protein
MSIIIALADFVLNSGRIELNKRYPGRSFIGADGLPHFQSGWDHYCVKENELYVVQENGDLVAMSVNGKSAFSHDLTLINDKNQVFVIKKA